jgi:hypothetical protein
VTKLNSTLARLFAGLVLFAGPAWILTPSTFAQAGPPPHGGHWGGFGPGGGFRHGGAAKVVTGEPYSAQAVTATVETLPNGTHITHQTTASIARDSEGRTMRSETLNGSGAAGSSQTGMTIVSIFDPVANQRIEYNTKGKTARVFVLPQKSTASPASGGTGNGANRHGHFNSQNVTVQSTSLGSQTISGVSADGTQTTRTVAAGAMGNDQPLVSTNQVWYSPDLQIVVQSTRTDPRFGQTTYTVSNIQQAEPNASLFQVPAGYQTKTIDVPSHAPAQ